MNDSAKPTAINADGTVRVAHLDHGGNATPIVAGATVSLTCPTCGAQSLWPPGGGADPSLAPLLAEIAAAAA